MRILLLSLTLATAFAQQQPAELPKAFEVVSIKPNAANDNRIMIRMAPGGGFSATGITLRTLIGQAFNMRDYQITGGPGWMGSDRWDVNAKGPEGMPERVPQDVLRPMLKNMLEERFQLKHRVETREMPVFVLTQVKGGHKMKVVEEVAPPPGPPAAGSPQRRPQMMRMGRGQFSGDSVPMNALVQQLSQILGRTVIDKTGLPGLYAVDLQWTPEPGQGMGGPGGLPAGAPDSISGADNSGPTIFTALQEKLGLKLDSQKGPVDFLVIESVAKPAEN